MAGTSGVSHIAPDLAERPTEPAAAYPHTRWNFTVIVTDASAFMTGLAFASPMIVIPLLVERLTGSTVLVGLVIALQMAGWVLPQLPVASAVEHRPRKKPFMLKVCLLGRLPVVLIPFALVVLAGRPHLVLAVLLAVHFLFFLSDGMTGVPWTDIGAKTIPPRLRGRFFGTMQLVAGTLSVLAGVAVRRILDDPRLPYPRDYALLFTIQFALIMVSWVFLALIREPVRPVRAERRGLRRMLRDAPGLLAGNPQFLRLIMVMALVGVGSLAVPFYAVYATEKLGVAEAMAGFFISAQMAGGIVSSMVWGLLSDRRGSKRVVQGTTICSLGTPLVALLVPLVLARHTPGALAYGYALTFFLLGATFNGTWIGPTNFVLELVGDEERPSYVALLYAMSAPLVLLPIIGGWLIRVTSYQVVFVIAALCGAIAVGATAWLREPRDAARRETSAA
ncbi:MAG: MFS transporter [Armatimonadota bacterium]|nr:MAG: MFS transporter [Armatimonadota bacterium]